MNDIPANSYDVVPYAGASYPETHPNRLATLARLFGMSPAPAERCRVLELGCAAGYNLIPLAETLPESRFVGIDTSARQIAAGQQAVQMLGLENLILDQMSIMDVPPDAGPFDYIIAHGVYSWVPPEVQDRLLAICRQNLTPDGVAYVSYNTYPGWHGRSLIRDLMRYHTRNIADPRERVAQGRAVLAVLAESTAASPGGYPKVLQEEQQRLRGMEDTYLFHEELEDINEPVYFAQFVARAARHGLQFLAESDFSSLTHDNFGPQIAAALRHLESDPIAREQYLDFFTNGAFRRTLLCHQEAPLRRQLGPERLPEFQVASRARRTSASSPDMSAAKPEQFAIPGKAAFSTAHPLTKAAMLHLEEVWPEATTLESLLSAARARLSAGGPAGTLAVQDAADLVQEDSRTANNLWVSFLAGGVELHAHPPRAAHAAGERPRAPGWVRLQAGGGATVTNLRHEVLALEPSTCFLLSLLDGRRDRAMLVEEFARYATAEGRVVQHEGRVVTGSDKVREVVSATLEGKLRDLARLALLTS